MRQPNRSAGHSGEIWMSCGGVPVIQAAADRVPPFRTVPWTARNGFRPARIAVRTGPAMPGAIRRVHPDRWASRTGHRDLAP
jgi:hypothetical protein